MTTLDHSRLTLESIVVDIYKIPLAAKDYTTIELNELVGQIVVGFAKAYEAIGFKTINLNFRTNMAKAMVQSYSLGFETAAVNDVIVYSAPAEFLKWFKTHYCRYDGRLEIEILHQNNKDLKPIVPVIVNLKLKDHGTIPEA